MTLPDETLLEAARGLVLDFNAARRFRTPCKTFLAYCENIDFVISAFRYSGDYRARRLAKKATEAQLTLVTMTLPNREHLLDRAIVHFKYIANLPPDDFTRLPVVVKPKNLPTPAKTRFA